MEAPKEMNEYGSVGKELVKIRGMLVRIKMLVSWWETTVLLFVAFQTNMHISLKLQLVHSKSSFVMYARFGGADEVKKCQKGKQKLKRCED